MREFVIPIVMVISSIALQGQGQSPTTAPTTAPAAGAVVPENVLRQIEQQFMPPETQPSADEISVRMQKVIDLGRQAEKDYPNASNLPSVQMAMLQAADFLRRIKHDDTSLKQENEICHSILQSSAPAHDKVQADFVCTLLTVRPEPTKPASSSAAEQIRKFAQRYQNTDVAALAYTFAARLAMQGDQDALRDQYVKVLKDKYLDDPQAKMFLKQIHEYSDIGQPFEATLTRLDGGTLKLPDDLRGKVVVVDFWATWCPPCVEAMGPMKDLYAKYKDRGVEFVDVSLDTDRQQLEKFVREHGLTWIQTCSGQVHDPTAVKYGVTTIPTVVVVGKDGRIVSDNADEQVEDFIQQALKAKYQPPVIQGRSTTQPAK